MLRWAPKPCENSTPGLNNSCQAFMKKQGRSYDVTFISTPVYWIFSGGKNTFHLSPLFFHGCLFLVYPVMAGTSIGCLFISPPLHMRGKYISRSWLEGLPPISLNSRRCQETCKGLAQSFNGPLLQSYLLVAETF